jgi:16S rRNA (uracil1498-N3)-methyltransferase
MLQRIVVSPSQLSHGLIQLSSEQQHYLWRVLRLGAGDRFLVMDGQGHTWLAQLNADRTLATVLEPVTRESELSVAVALVMALPKGSGFDDIVRQATELGVSRLVPVVSDRTLLQPSANKLDRWRRIAQEAAEQSERQRVPTIEAPVAFADYLKQAGDDRSTKFLCVTRRDSPHLLHCLERMPPHSPILLAIGPEGGWTDAEVEGAIGAGYQPVTLGSRILRAVTAPIVALAIVSARLESRD